MIPSLGFQGTSSLMIPSFKVTPLRVAEDISLSIPEQCPGQRPVSSTMTTESMLTLLYGLGTCKVSGHLWPHPGKAVAYQRLEFSV